MVDVKLLISDNVICKNVNGALWQYFDQMRCNRK